MHFLSVIASCSSLFTCPILPIKIHVTCVCELQAISKCQAMKKQPYVSFCRWNNTPMDEAMHFGHHDVVTILQDYQNNYTPLEQPDSEKEEQTVQKNLDGLL